MPKHNVSTRNIDTIKATLLRPATTSHFEVRIGIPRNTRTSGLGSHLRGFLSGNSQENLNLMCCEAVLPGSQLATTEITNNYTGVTERHAYRRIYDETIDLTFYVDAGNYLPIIFFETWMNGIVNEDQDDAVSGNYNYRVKYPDDYVAQGLQVIKFEKDYHSQITGRIYNVRKGSGTSVQYDFVRSYPRSITSMPVSYDGSNLLKCSVQMSYVRYVVTPSRIPKNRPSMNVNPSFMGLFNSIAGSEGGGQTASGQMMQRGQLGSDIRRALTRQGLSPTAGRVRFTGTGNNMVVNPF